MCLADRSSDSLDLRVAFSGSSEDPFFQWGLKGFCLLDLGAQFRFAHRMTITRILALTLDSSVACGMGRFAVDVDTVLGLARTAVHRRIGISPDLAPKLVTQPLEVLPILRRGNLICSEIGHVSRSRGRLESKKRGRSLRVRQLIIS